MEQACWHSGVGAAMGFCVVDWGVKDLGWKAFVEGFGVCREAWARFARAERVGLLFAGCALPLRGRRIDAAFCGSAFVTGYAGSPLRGRRRRRRSFAALG